MVLADTSGGITTTALQVFHPTFCQTPCAQIVSTNSEFPYLLVCVRKVLCHSVLIQVMASAMTVL